MRLVTRRTGLSPDVLRVWERRYDVVRPGRSEGGQRLYSEDDVQRLILLGRAVRAGYGIARAARLSRDELIAAASSVQPSAGISGSEDVHPDAMLAPALAAVDAYDAATLETLLRNASVTYTSTEFMEDVVGPLLREVGERWHKGAITPAHEHLATATVRRVLDWLAAAADAPAGAPLIVIATLPGEAHEIGAMLAARVAVECGWRMRYFGAALPPADLAAAAQHLGARAVAVSLVNTEPDGRVSASEELRALRAALPDRVTLFAGGRAAAARAAELEALGARVPEGLSAFRAELRRHAERLTR